MPAVGEDLEPLVEGGLLLLEQDVPALQEAEAALLRGGVVAAGSGQDGPVQLVGDELINFHQVIPVLIANLQPGKWSNAPPY